MKKVFGFIFVLLLAVVLVACGEETNDDTIRIKVWGPGEEKALFDEMSAAYIAANPDKKYDFTFFDVGEDKAREEYIKDPDAAADVFMFANDQIQELNGVGALLEIQGDVKANVIANNVEGAVNAATVGGKLLGLPFTADNGYFMYYDKSKLTEDDVKSFDGILAKATATSQFYFPFETGWYMSSLLLTVGDLEYVDGGLVNYNPVLADIQNAAVAAVNYINDSKVLTTVESLGSSFADGAIIAGISGTWDAEAVQTALGENYAATKLPTATINGEQVQLSSFAGYKIVGVNAQSKQKDEAVKYAEFISNEANQIRRVEVRGAGPSNIKAQEADVVKNNIALSALAQQSEFAKGQGVIPDASYWAPVTAFGVAIKNGEITLANLNEKVQDLLDRINRVS